MYLSSFFEWVDRVSDTCTPWMGLHPHWYRRSIMQQYKKTITYCDWEKSRSEMLKELGHNIKRQKELSGILTRQLQGLDKPKKKPKESPQSLLRKMVKLSIREEALLDRL